MLSEKEYWIFLIVVFACFALGLIVWLIPSKIVEYNLGVNLLTSSIFMILTVFFLSWLSKLRQDREWQDMKKQVENSLSRELYEIFCFLGGFVYPDQISPLPLKDEVLRVLERINETKEASLADSAYLYYPKPQDWLLQHNLERFFDLKQSIGDLEIRYFNLMKPEIRTSLMEIQDDLTSIRDIFDFVRKEETTEGTFEQPLADSILHILKEIYMLHKKGIEVYNRKQ
jgi:hypothetical protein